MSGPRTAAEPCAACGQGERRRRFTIDGFDLDACVACGTIHARPLPADIVLHAYYDEAYALVGHVRRAGAEEKARTYVGTPRVLELLARHAPAARSVAEVGCASGYLLWGLRDRGYEVHGYELSATTAEAARRELGLEVTTAALPPEGVTYDAIVMRHVLEHVLDPASVVARLHACLRPGGILLLATPNAGSWAARFCGEDWEWMSPPAHLHLFTPTGLRRLLERSGFAVEFVETMRGDARPLPVALLRRVASRLGARRALTRRLGNLQDDGGGGAGAARGRGLRRLVLGAAEGVERLAAPLRARLARRGEGEELWMIGRR